MFTQLLFFFLTPPPVVFTLESSSPGEECCRDGLHLRRRADERRPARSWLCGRGASEEGRLMSSLLHGLCPVVLARLSLG